MRRDIWIFLFAAGLIFFSWPVISIFQQDLSKYLFLAWFVFIGCIAIAASFPGKRNGGG